MYRLTGAPIPTKEDLTLGSIESSTIRFNLLFCQVGGRHTEGIKMNKPNVSFSVEECKIQASVLFKSPISSTLRSCILLLAALVPAPRVNLIRYHGVLAPNSRHLDPLSRLFYLFLLLLNNVLSSLSQQKHLIEVAARSKKITCIVVYLLSI
jgi:hypothetical protein